MWLDDEQNNNQSGNNLNSPSVGSGGSTGISAAPAGSNPSTVTPVGSTPQQKFATVQDYLGANKQQGEALGADFTGKLNESATNEKNVIDTAANQTQNDITSGSTAFNQDLVNKATTAPTEVANSPDQLSSFLGQWNAAYKGPQSFETSANYTPAITAANEATQKAGEVGTAGGREQLLSDTYGVYGQGNKGLDQAILQNSSAFPTIQAAQPAFNSISDYLGTKATALNMAIPQAKTNTQQTQDLTRNTVNTGISNLGTQISNEGSVIKGQGANVQNNPAANFFSNLPANPDDSDLALAGMTRGEYNAISKNYYPDFTPTSAISNPLFAANPKYQTDLAQYLAAQNLQKQALASQF